MSQSEEMRLAAIRAVTAIVNESTRSKMTPSKMAADVSMFLCEIAAGNSTIRGTNPKLDEFLTARGFGAAEGLQTDDLGAQALFAHAADDAQARHYIRPLELEPAPGEPWMALCGLVAPDQDHEDPDSLPDARFVHTIKLTTCRECLQRYQGSREKVAHEAAVLAAEREAGIG